MESDGACMMEGADMSESAQLAIDVLTDSRTRFFEFVRARVESEETAEDILQAAYAKSLDKARDLRSEIQVIPWFYRVLRNAVADHYRRRAVEERMRDHLQTEGVQVVQPPPTNMICQCVHAALESLPEAYATVLRQVVVDEISIPEFAHGAGISANTASVRLHRARKQLRRRLLDICGECAQKSECLDCTCSAPGDA